MKKANASNNYAMISLATVRLTNLTIKMDRLSDYNKKIFEEEFDRLCKEKGIDNWW